MFWFLQQVYSCAPYRLLFYSYFFIFLFNPSEDKTYIVLFLYQMVFFKTLNGLHINLTVFQNILGHLPSFHYI